MPSLHVGSRGGTPLRDPGVRASLLSPQVGSTPGVLNSKQLNITPVPRKPASQAARNAGARDCIPAHQPHMATPALMGDGQRENSIDAAATAMGGLQVAPASQCVPLLAALSKGSFTHANMAYVMRMQKDDRTNEYCTFLG